MDSGERWRLGHRPGLDGLRGVAILLVVLNHIGMPGCVHVGQAGVGAFFVLSGFLITSLLLEQVQTGGRIWLGTFYVRRALRLGPALITCVLFGWALASVAQVPIGPSPWAALLYVMDFVQAGHGTFASGLFAHTWSLAIEEQFYLLWPLVLLGLLRLRISLFWTLAGLAVALVGWTLWLSASGASLARIEYAPDTRAAGLIAGCALAAAFASRPLPTLPRWASLAALIALPVIGLAPDFGLSDVAEVVLAVPVSVVLVWACVDGGRVPGLSARWLRVLGKRSYGVYLWHLPIIGFVYFAAAGRPWWLLTLTALTLTAGVVELSWRRLEKPLLALGQRSDEGSMGGDAGRAQGAPVVREFVADAGIHHVRPARRPAET